jgi:TP901 family phage tail tape measure protein
VASDAQGYAYIDVALLTKQAEAQIKSLNDALNKIGSGMDKKAPEVVDQMQKSAVSATKSFDNLAKAQETAGLKTSAAVTRLNGYRTALVQNSAAIKAQEANIKTLTATYGADSSQVREATNRLTEMRTQQVLLTAQTGKLGKEIGGLTPAMAGAIDKVNLFSQKTKSIGESMSGIGQTMTIGLTAPIIGGFGLATKASMDFNSELAKLRPLLNDGHTSAGELDKQIVALGNHSKQWSVQYGVATSSINEGMETLIKRGYTYNQTLGAMPSILQAAKASGDDFNTVMQVSTSTLEQFGMKSNNTATMLKNTQKVTDDLTYVANKTSSGFSDLGMAMSYVGPTAHSMGMSLEETTATLGELSQQGIEGEKAGTGLRSVLSSLTNPIGQNIEGMKKLGVNTAAFKKGTIGLPEVIDSIKKNTEGWTDTEKSAALQQAFGIDGQNAMNILVNEGADSIRDLTKAQKDATGYTKSQADQQMQSSKAHMEQLKAATNELAIEFGDKLLPQVTEIIEKATDLIDWFSKLDDSTQQMIIKTGLLAAAGGPVLSLTGKLISGFGSLTGGSVKLLAGMAKMSPLLGTISKDGSTASKVLAGLGVAGEAGSGSLLTLGGSIGTTVAGLGSLALAAAPVALGIAAVGTAGYFAIKSAKEHEAENERYKKSMDTFGTNISDNSQKAIGAYNNLHQSAVNDMAQLDTATVAQSKQLSSDVVSKYSQMADLIIGKFNETKTKGQAALTSLSASFGPAGATWLASVNASMNGKTNDAVSKLQQAKKTIQDLLNSVGGDFSKLSATQRQQLQEAENYIDSQTSVFGMAYKDQLKLQQEYANQHGTLTKKVIKQDLNDADDAFKKSSIQAKKTYTSQLKDLSGALKNQEITQSQYNQAKAMLDAKRNQQETQAGIEWVNTQKAVYDHYNNNGKESLRTHQTLDDEFTREVTDSNGKKTKLYWDDVTNSEVSAQEWINNHKKDNAQYIKDQEDAHGSIKKQLADFQSNQEKAYKKMGLTDIDAIAQAKVDADNLKAELTKQGSEVSKSASQIHDSFIEGLKKGTVGDPTQIAKQWGLDITTAAQKVDLGKYGTKTAQQFWSDFQSGSKTGYEEAKVYFQTQLSQWDGDGQNTFKEIGTKGVAQLKAGLQSGVLTLSQLKPVFGNEIIDLFPKDLSQASKQEINTLKDGLNDGVLSLKDLKKKFGDEIYQLFPDDLGSLSKAELKTLSDGYKNGTIADKNAIQQKYDTEINGIFNKNLSQLGIDNLNTLANGFKAGLPSAQKALQDISGMIDKDLTVNLTGKGEYNIDTLISGFKNKKLSVTEFTNGLSALISQNLKANTDPSGQQTIQDYANGMTSKKSAATGAATNVKNDSAQALAPDDKPGQHGQEHTNDFSWGILHKKQEAIDNATAVRDDAASALTPTGAPEKHGEEHSNGFGLGLYTLGGVPIGVAADITTGVNDNFNKGIDSANNLSTSLGGKKTGSHQSANVTRSLPRGYFHANGTNGKLTTDQPAVVGDGGKEELIDYGNGQIGLSPSIPTFTMLPAGAQVFSGDDTDKVRPIMQSLGVPMFAKGTGGSIVDWIKKLFGDAMKFIEHPIDNWKKLVDNTYDMTPFGSDTSNIGSSGKEFEKKQTNWLNVLKKKVEAEAVSGPAGAGAQRWASIVKKVGDAMGQNPTAGEISRIVNVIDHESSGNPNITQGIWDINMANGTPARGLLQFVPSTFARYMVPGHTNILSGEDQLYAMFNDTNWRSDVKTGGWGPTGGRRLQFGQHVTKEMPALIGDNPQHDEFVINGYAGNAGALTSELLDQMAQVNPAALQQVKLPKAMFASAEVVSGYQPATQMFSQSGATNNGGSNDLTVATRALVDGLQKAQGKLEIHLDGYTEQIVYPLIKQLLGRDQMATINRLGGIH